MKTSLLILLLIISTNISQAQTYSWAKSGGNLKDDEGKSICSDSDGNYFVVGDFAGPEIKFDDFVLNNPDTSKNYGHNDMFLVKYNQAGKVLWAKNLETNGFVYDVCTDKKGNVYLTGFFRGNNDSFKKAKITNSYSYKDSEELFILKYSSEGEFLMSILGSGNWADFGNGIAVDDLGNIFVTGMCGDSLHIGETVFKGKLRSIFVLKLDSTGNVIWGKLTGGFDGNEGKSIAVDSLGNCYVTGYFNSPSINFGSIKLKNFTTNTCDFFVAKLDPDGKTIWAVSNGGINNDVGNDIAVDKNGNCFVLGTHVSKQLIFNKDTLAREGYHDDIFLVKYDSKGKAIWARTAKGEGTDWGTSLCLDKNGNSFITGKFENSQINFGGIKLIGLDFEKMKKGHFKSDFYVTKYDENGKVLWAKNSDHYSFAEAYGICHLPNGELVITGTFQGHSMDLNPITINNNYIDENKYTRDVFVFKLKEN